MLGKLVVVGLMIGMVAAFVPAVFLLARHGAAARKMAIPFGPFLAFGAVVALFFGDAMLDAYLSGSGLG
jgi:leader peptidase (prepilin peptidase) / N-methyltransferase